MAESDQPLIGLVGPCKSGKTMLQRRLEARGFTVRHIAQEHSFVPDMWQKIAHPDILIFLDASFETTLARSSLHWHRMEYDEQLRRLAHAREHADLIVDTNPLTPEQIEDTVLDFLEKREMK